MTAPALTMNTLEPAPVVPNEVGFAKNKWKQSSLIEMSAVCSLLFTGIGSITVQRACPPNAKKEPHTRRGMRLCDE